MKFLYPKEYVKSVFDIDFDQLHLSGYRGIMFDIDNTLAAFDEEHPSQAIIDLMVKLQRLGFGVSLLSNNNSKRVHTYNHSLNVYAYPNAGKPFTRTLKRAMAKMNVSKKETVFIGDQLFTDVWAGNLLELHTILVEPIQVKEQFITKIKRGVESLILKGYLKHQEHEKRSKLF